MQSPGPHPYQGHSLGVDQHMLERPYDSHLNSASNYASYHQQTAIPTHNSSPYANSPYANGNNHQRPAPAYNTGHQYPPNNGAQYSIPVGDEFGGRGRQSYPVLSRPSLPIAKTYWSDTQSMTTLSDPYSDGGHGVTSPRPVMAPPPVRSPTTGVQQQQQQVHLTGNGYPPVNRQASSPSWSHSHSPRGTPSPLPVSHSTSNSRSPSHCISPYSSPSPVHSSQPLNKVVAHSPSSQEVGSNGGSNPLQSLQQMVMADAESSSSSTSQSFDPSCSASPSSSNAAQAQKSFYPVEHLNHHQNQQNQNHQHQIQHGHANDGNESAYHHGPATLTYYNMDQNRLCSPPQNVIAGNGNVNANAHYSGTALATTLKPFSEQLQQQRQQNNFTTESFNAVTKDLKGDLKLETSGTASQNVIIGRSERQETDLASSSIADTKSLTLNNGSLRDESNSSINLKCDESLKMSSNSGDSASASASASASYYSPNNSVSDNELHFQSNEVNSKSTSSNQTWPGNQWHEGRTTDTDAHNAPWPQTIGGRETTNYPVGCQPNVQQQHVYQNSNQNSNQNQNNQMPNQNQQQPPAHLMMPPHSLSPNAYHSSASAMVRANVQWPGNSAHSPSSGAGTPDGQGSGGSKKKRGRPFGSKNKPKAQAAGDQIINDNDHVSLPPILTMAPVHLQHGQYAETPLLKSPAKKLRRRGSHREESVGINTSISFDVNENQEIGILPLESLHTYPVFIPTQGPAITNLSSKKKSSAGPYIKVENDKTQGYNYLVVNTARKDDDKDSKKQRIPVENYPLPGKRPSILGASKRKVLNSIAQGTDSSDTRDQSWLCVFCKQTSHYRSLGDLFGPYYVGVENKGLHGHEPEAGTSYADEYSKGRQKSPVGKRKMSRDGQVTPERKHSTGNADMLETHQHEVWFHEDCITWSSGVYLVGHQIRNMDEIVKDSSVTVCTNCTLPGANLACLHKSCLSRFHYLCSRDQGCELDEENFSVFCPKHHRKITEPMGMDTLIPL